MKLGYLTGTVERPAADSTDLPRWIRSEYEAIKSQILSMEPLPSFNKVEKQRQLTVKVSDSSAFMAGGKSSQDGGSGFKKEGRKPFNGEKKHCTMCNMDGHIAEGCFEVLGYPDWYKGKKNKRGTKVASNVVLDGGTQDTLLGGEDSCRDNKGNHEDAQRESKINKQKHLRACFDDSSCSLQDLLSNVVVIVGKEYGGLYKMDRDVAKETSGGLLVYPLLMVKEEVPMIQQPISNSGRESRSSIPNPTGPNFNNLNSEAQNTGSVGDGDGDGETTHTLTPSTAAAFGGLGDARLVFDEMPEPCKVSCNSMLDAFVANGDISSAVSLFDSMSERDVYSWTSMINGLSQKGHYRMAIGFLRKMMMQSSVKPNEATFVSILSCCANSDEGGALYQGKEIHGYMIKNETELTVFMGTALISLYGKLGCLGTALKVFNQSGHRKICTWNAILSSLASNGGEKEALDLAGLLNEAKEFIKEMPFTPDETVLGALLGACKVHGAIELGNEVGKRLLDLQLMHCGRYVALSSMNALAERWGSAADYRRAMSKAGIRKIPAYSLIDPLRKAFSWRNVS
ncbi:hypothetical protein V2J09_020430 [Rumex salicifolius]